MKRLPRRSTPAVLVALTVLAACVLAAVVSVQTLLGQDPWVDPRAVFAAVHDTRWEDPVVALTAAVCVVLGAGLLLCAVLPGNPVVLPLRDDDPDTRSTMDSGVTRRSLRNVLRTAASSVDGVTAARLTLGRRTITTTVSTDRTITDGLAAAVRGAVENRLDRIRPAIRPAVVVHVKARRTR
ncbi:MULTISPECIES: DUF6286 domain-containing protein [Lentzea]|uniref:DUF6286 domain-containing protein n=2 Tax=Lentzea TaxID=165301 RepID=A0A1G7WGQ1_9PSEU|nr:MULTISPECIES: DUF6286 domain-containing protein [Lentzea]SDG71121.1 hypothetical protein SAMN05216553_110375 [Lentzea fradiae]SES43209.1 hypothetical protein SAMN04488000_13111 [Lentzea albida]